MNDPRRARPIAGKLFVVGDPKQSIYRFRRADVSLYQRIKAELIDAGAALVHLTETFRALPAIVSAVNQSFAPAMIGAGHAEYVAMDVHRAPLGDQPALIALPVPDPYGKYGDFHKDAIRASAAEAVVAFVEWLVTSSGWRVCEPGAAGEEQVPIKPQHVCLMFRDFRDWYAGDLTRAYVRELEGRRLPHVLVGGQAFHTREEVLAVRTAMNAIEWPKDELEVYATLRGPLFSLSDDRLFDFRFPDDGSVRQLDPLRRWDDADLDDQAREVVRALQLVGRLHRSRNDRPIAATIGRLLAETRAHASMAIWPSGEQALANVQRLLEQARRFESRGATSFRAFIDQLADDAERGQGSDAAVVEEGAEGVRIMTVHKAKGLEFPIVILCDPERSKGDAPSRYIDSARRLWAFRLAGCSPTELADHAEEIRAEDAAEEIRVAYVAATRARDLLVVPVVGDARRRGWLDVLHDAVYPSSSSRRDSEPAARCPSFGPDSVRTRPASAGARPDESVKPGAHRIGDHQVIWWDPQLLRLDLPSAGGLGQTELLRASDEGGSAGAIAEAHRSWRSALDATIARAKSPSVSAASITALSIARSLIPAKGDESSDSHSVRWESVAVDRSGRPGGARFGTLVHMVLAELPLTAAAAEIAAVTRAAARAIAAPDDERRAAEIAVTAALAHPLLRRAAALAGPHLRREEPLVLAEPDGSFAEGIVDLAFHEGHWIVVDFKTDGPSDSPERAVRYAAQVAFYCRAIEAATGSPAEGFLLWV